MHSLADKYHGGVPTDRWQRHTLSQRDAALARMMALGTLLGATMMATALTPTKVQTVTTNFASVASISQSITVTNAKDTLIATAWNTGVTSGYAASAVSGAGATWFLVGTIVNATAAGAIDIWVGINASSGAQTVSITMNGTHTSGCNVDEWSALDASVLINQANLFASVTGNGTTQTVTPSQLTYEPNTVAYAAVATTIGTATVTSSPASPWTAETGPTSSGTQVAGIAYQIMDTSGLAGGNAAPTWGTSGSAQYAGLQVFLKAEQPSGYAIWNDTASGVNAGVLETQATPEYFDSVITALEGDGTGILNGCAIVPYTFLGATFSIGSWAGTALVNWAPTAIAVHGGQAITAADATNPRRDLVYLAPGNATPIYLAGTAAATPCIPTPPVFPFVALAVIDVPANATVVDAPGIASPNTAHAQITDKRCLINYPLSLRDAYTKPAAAIIETVPLSTALAIGSSSVSMATGVLQLGLIPIPAGTPIGHIAFLSATAANTPTNYWFALFDQNLNMLAITANQTTTAWGASTLKTLAIATTAEGANTSFTTRYSGVYYIGVMMTFSSTWTLAGVPSVSTGAVTTPPLGGRSTGSLTTPPGFPLTAAGISSAFGIPYGYVAA